MRIFILLIGIAVYLTLSACSNSQKNGTGDIRMTSIDSTKVANIDTIAIRINKQWKADSNLHRVMLNARDSVEYYEINGEPQRISSLFYTDSTSTWVTFHQVNNELITVRFRQMKQNAKGRTVVEAISYLENGKIFHSKERTKIIGEGEQLGSFREANFIENARSPEQLEAEYKPYWDITFKALQSDIASRRNGNQ